MSVNTLEQDVARLLSEGQAAARRGDRAMARALLTQLVEQDPRNEEAWMWLSGVVTDPDEQQICLENALVINPYNTHARRGLEFVVARTNTPPRVPLTPPPAPQFADPAQAHSPHADMQDELPTEAAPAEPLPVAPQSPPEFTLDAYASDAAPTASIADTLHAPFDNAPIPAPDVPLNDYTAPIGPADVPARPALDPFSLSDEESFPELDAQPFVPPGMEGGAVHAFAVTPGLPSPAPAHQSGGLLNATPDQIGEELPNWLQELTPSVPVSGQQEQPYSHYNMADFPAQPTQAHPIGGMGSPAQAGAMPAPAQPFGPADLQGMPDMGLGALAGPVGPYSEVQMPSPHELPGGQDPFGPPAQQPHQQHQAHGSAPAAQPWYLQGTSSAPSGSSYLDSTMLKSSTLSSQMLSANLGERQNGIGVMMPCPNCKEQVSDKSLVCPTCRFNFFVNCPHCHELLDTSDAVQGAEDHCPYCSKVVSKMALGMGTGADLVSQKNPGSRPAQSGPGPDPAFPAMKQTLAINTAARKGFSWGWLVDLLWLIAVIAMVWALTQLPTWLNLSGQY